MNTYQFTKEHKTSVRIGEDFYKLYFRKGETVKGSYKKQGMIEVDLSSKKDIKKGKMLVPESKLKKISDGANEGGITETIGGYYDDTLTAMPPEVAGFERRDVLNFGLGFISAILIRKIF